MTSASTTSAHSSSESPSSGYVPKVSRNLMEDSLPEPVILPDRMVSGPADFESNYPEVAFGPVTAIHADN